MKSYLTTGCVVKFSGNLKSSQQVAKLVLTRTGCIIRRTWCDAWDQWNGCVSNWNVKDQVFFLAWHGAVIETTFFLSVSEFSGNLKSTQKVAIFRKDGACIERNRYVASFPES